MYYHFNLYNLVTMLRVGFREIVTSSKSQTGKWQSWDRSQGLSNSNKFLSFQSFVTLFVILNKLSIKDHYSLSQDAAAFQIDSGADAS